MTAAETLRKIAHAHCRFLYGESEPPLAAEYPDEEFAALLAGAAALEREAALPTMEEVETAINALAPICTVLGKEVDDLFALFARCGVK